MRNASESGFMHLGFAAVLVLCVCSSIFMIGTLIRWRHTVELQLRLDQCVARTARELKTSLQRVETLNLAIHTTRSGIVAATMNPGVAAPLRLALSAQVAAQEVILKNWDLRRLKWVVQRGCDSKRDVVFPLPSQPWVREPPDAIGHQALSWIGNDSRVFRIFTQKGSRFSAALIEDRNTGGLKSDWRAKWTTRLQGAGLN